MEVGSEMSILDRTKLILENNFVGDSYKKSVIIGDSSESNWLRLNHTLIIVFS